MTFQVKYRGTKPTITSFSQLAETWHADNVWPNEGGVHVSGGISASEYIRFDFGVGIEPIFQRLLMRFPHSSNYITECTIQHSSDASSWTSVKSFTGLSGPASELELDFADSVTLGVDEDRYWQIKVDAATSSNYELDDCRWYEQREEILNTLGDLTTESLPTITSGSELSAGFHAENVWPGEGSVYVSDDWSAAYNETEFITFQFPGDKLFGKLILFPPHLTSKYVAALTVRSSVDGSTWMYIKSFNNIGGLQVDQELDFSDAISSENDVAYWGVILEKKVGNSVEMDNFRFFEALAGVSEGPGIDMNPISGTRRLIRANGVSASLSKGA